MASRRHWVSAGKPALEANCFDIIVQAAVGVWEQGRGEQGSAGPSATTARNAMARLSGVREFTMSKVSGLLLVLAGIGAAVYVMPTGIGTREADLFTSTDVAKYPPAVSVRTAVVERAPEVRPVPERSSQPVVPPKPQIATRPAEPRAPAHVEPPAAKAPVVVTLAQRPSDAAPRAPAALPSRAAGLPADRASLTRELQRELKRVGCYDGDLNGTWTAQSRRAMKSFTDRVNATLPIDEPDYILLTLVQGHHDKACGKPCPAGQGVTDDGRCVPSAILAQAARKAAPGGQVAAAPRSLPAETPTPAITGWSTTATAAAPPAAPLPAVRPPTEGRMALAGPSGPSGNEQSRLAPVRANPPPRAIPFSGPMPAIGVYDRRPPPPPRYVQGPQQRGSPLWARGLFKRLENNAH